MYSKEEISKTKQAFWTAFGQYMKPVPTASGERVNWANYKTGIPHIYFRMQAEKANVSVAIEITGPAAGREETYEKLSRIKNLLPGEWIWEKQTADENGHAISRIYAMLNNVQVMNKEDWPAIISFFKERMIMLDRFWSDIKFSFG